MDWSWLQSNLKAIQLSGSNSIIQIQRLKFWYGDRERKKKENLDPINSLIMEPDLNEGNANR